MQADWWSLWAAQADAAMIRTETAEDAGNNVLGLMDAEPHLELELHVRPAGKSLGECVMGALLPVGLLVK